MTTATISQQLQSINATLAGFSSLSPSPVVNQTFSALVSLVTTTPDELATSLLQESCVQTILPELQSYAASGETALEEYWVEKFLSQPLLTYKELAQFPYFHNYEALAQLEVTALRKHNLLTKPLLFVGGGPLPLSAIIFAKQYGLRVHIIDCNQQAVDYSLQLIKRLDLTQLISISQADIHDYIPTDLTIFLAAMVGNTEAEKKAVYAHLASIVSNEATIVSRSVSGLGECLYPRKPASSYFEDIAEYRGNRDIINTVVISKKI